MVPMSISGIAFEMPRPLRSTRSRFIRELIVGKQPARPPTTGGGRIPRRAVRPRPLGSQPSLSCLGKFRQRRPHRLRADHPRLCRGEVHNSGEGPC